MSGRAELFDELRPHLFGDLEVAPYAQIATRLNMTVVAVKVTVHRLRQRYGELLRQEVAHTLADRPKSSRKSVISSQPLASEGCVRNIVAADVRRLWPISDFRF